MRFKSIMLLVTHGCNLNCSYCYEQKNTSVRMSVSVAKEILSREIGQIGDDYEAFEIQFMGGEPLMNYGLIREVSEWLWSVSWPKKLLTVFIPTNGTLLNEEMKQWFYLNRERICLGLSFDGDSVMQNVNRSLSSQRIDLHYFSSVWPEQSVKMTISPMTVDAIYNGVSSLWECGFKSVSADLAMGRNVEWRKEHLSVFRNEIRKFVDHYLSDDAHNTFSMMRLPVLSLSDNNVGYSGKQCNCGEDLVCVDVDGKTYPCHLFSPLSIPDASVTGNIDAVDFCDHKSFDVSPCRECFLNPICTNHCYGMNYKTYGNILKNSPFHCAAFKLLFLENCRMHHELACKNNDAERQKSIERLIDKIHYSYEE